MHEVPTPAVARTRHLKIRIGDRLADELTTYAAGRDLSLSDAVRVLLHASLNPPQLPEEIKVFPSEVKRS